MKFVRDSESNLYIYTYYFKRSDIFSRHFTYLSARVKSQNYTIRRIRTRDNDLCTRFEMSVLLLLEHDVVFETIAVCRHKPNTIHGV